MGVAVPNPFPLRILKNCAARTLLLAMVTFATLLFSGCANGDFIYTVPPQNTRAKPNAREKGAVPQSWVDWTKDARSQTGDTYPRGHKGLGTP